MLLTFLFFFYTYALFSPISPLLPDGSMKFISHLKDLSLLRYKINPGIWLVWYMINEYIAYLYSDAYMHIPRYSISSLYYTVYSKSPCGQRTGLSKASKAHLQEGWYLNRHRTYLSIQELHIRPATMSKLSKQEQH